MKLLTTIFFFFLTTVVFSQGEANNWFFGYGAGIHFNEDGSVSPLPGSPIHTNEGCSSISDPEGNLLFYTDGRNVWDRNHVLMPNGNYTAGTGLLGDPSSTQSGIIIPKKDNPDIYYIFTVDEPHHNNANVYPNQFTGVYDSGGTVPGEDDGFNNGLNYSIVDLSVTGANGSIGDVVTRNVHLVTYDPLINQQLRYKCSEKITAVKNSTGSGYWVITHFVNAFYAFEITDAGVTETPVITPITPTVPTLGYRRNAIGYLKASPDGHKLAIAHRQLGEEQGGSENNGVVYLYDFDNVTGGISNPVLIRDNSGPYGVEFSPESKKLYVSYDSIGLMQYDLLATDVPASEAFIGSNGSGAAIQLGPNGKIYCAVLNASVLNVINNPDEPAFAAGFQSSGVTLSGGMQCIFGLPPFITSFFSAEIEITNTCFGDQTEFSVDALGDVDAVAWDFGDGTTSNELNATHVYAATGNYTVSATITKDGEVDIATKDITIHEVPVANAAVELRECDPDNNDVATFNLSENDSNILGTQSATTFEVKYYRSENDANTKSNPLNATAYENTSNPQTLYARVQNKDNTRCYALTTFEISVSTTPLLNSNSYSICDDAQDGSDTNGKATFNLTAVKQELMQDLTANSADFFATEANAQNNTNLLPVQFTNTTANQQVIYIRAVNNSNTDCTIVEPITLNVNPLPAVVYNAVLVQCDLGANPDGLTQFNLTQADDVFTNGDTNLAVTYFVSQANATNTVNEITEAFSNTANPQTVYAKVTDLTTGCFRVLPLRLDVNTLSTAPATLETCDIDGTEDGFFTFNLEDAGMENGVDAVVYYANAEDALLEQNPITDLNYTNVVAYEQTAYARVENGNDCSVLREIKLIVHALPDIETEHEQIICNNTGEYVLLTSGINGSPVGHTFLWSTGATTNSIMVNQAGTYTVMVTNSHGCEKLRTITVNASDVAIINHIEVNDLSDNNTITVYATPRGGVNTTYQYSLDLPNGPFTPSNYFEDVEPGIHTVYVYDTNGCGIVQQEVAVLAIPKFFTPNGDGTNDYWNVVGIKSDLYEKSKIYIYDRYGKFIAGVKPMSLGWDGTYNGRKLPATDYWYVVSLQDGRVVKGHFSMVR